MRRCYARNALAARPAAPAARTPRERGAARRTRSASRRSAAAPATKRCAAGVAEGGPPPAQEPKAAAAGRETAEPTMEGSIAMFPHMMTAPTPSVRTTSRRLGAWGPCAAAAMDLRAATAGCGGEVTTSSQTVAEPKPAIYQRSVAEFHTGKAPDVHLRGHAEARVRRCIECEAGRGREGNGVQRNVRHRRPSRRELGL